MNEQRIRHKKPRTRNQNSIKNPTTPPIAQKFDEKDSKNSSEEKFNTRIKIENNLHTHSSRQILHQTVYPEFFTEIKNTNNSQLTTLNSHTMNTSEQALPYFNYLFFQPIFQNTPSQLTTKQLKRVSCLIQEGGYDPLDPRLRQG